MANSNRITKVAIVGAGGNSGSVITKALLQTGRHTVTALTRADSKSELPDGVVTKNINYENLETLIEALRGQDALVITLSGHTTKETELKLIEAAGEAGVGWILPNEWGPDTANEALVRDVAMFQPKVTTRKAISDLGKSSYIAVATGIWYEWGLAMPEGFGIDFEKRTAILFDEGETKMSTSTLPQVGRAVAALLSLPIKPEDGNEEVCLQNFKDKVVYINSFTVTQRQILDSAIRVTSTTIDNWTITKGPVQERFEGAMKEIREGKHTAFPRIMSRLFYPDGCGDFEGNKGTTNGLLGLPKEDIDEATNVAVARAKIST